MTTVGARTRSRERRERLLPALVPFTLLLAVILSARPASAQDNLPRFEVAPTFSLYHAQAFATIRPDRFQLGGRFTWNWLPHLALEAEYDSTLKPEDLQSAFEGGYFSQGLFGVKSGVRWKSWGLFAKFRPGFISYSKVITSANFAVPSNPFTFGRLTDAAFDTGGGAEFLLSRRWLFRYDASDLIVHQGAIHLPNNGKEVTFLPLTFNNFEAEVSVAFRF